MRIYDLFEETTVVPGEDFGQMADSSKPGDYMPVYPTPIKGENPKLEAELAKRGINMDAYRYWVLIQKYCSDYVAAVRKSKKFLYRGVTSKGDQVFFNKARPDRKPKDTNELTQQSVDQVLKAAGFKALRGNSIFATSDSEQAEDYGRLYAVFPFNNANITWNMKYEDLWTDAIAGSSFHAFVARNYGITTLSSKIDEPMKAMWELARELGELESYPADYGYSQTDAAEFSNMHTRLVSALSNGRPANIVNAAKYCYRTIMSMENYQRTLKAHIQNLTKLNTVDVVDLHKQDFSVKDAKVVAEKMGFVQGFLPDAMRVGHEVYISGWYFLFPMVGKYHHLSDLHPDDPINKMMDTMDQVKKLTLGKLKIPPYTIS